MNLKLKIVKWLLRHSHWMCERYIIFFPTQASCTDLKDPEDCTGCVYLKENK